jgi:hypothetical protein
VRASCQLPPAGKFGLIVDGIDATIHNWARVPDAERDLFATFDLFGLTRTP